MFARALSAVVYADAGNAFSELRSAEDAIAGTLVGVGAELRLSAIYWYNVGLTGRLGYGMGLTDGGYAPGDPRGLYLRLGGSF